MILLIETMNRRNVVVDIQEWLAYNPADKCGGLTVLWKIRCEVDIIVANKNILDVKV